MKFVKLNPDKIISRRSFIKKSSAVIASTAFMSQIAYPDSTPKKIKIGVVGGSFGLGFQWQYHPDCIVDAVSDLRPERKARLMEVYKCAKSYDSLEELVKDPAIDAVAVFTEGPNHAKHVIECMKNGKHVISAVPACMGGGVEQAHQLLDAVEKFGLSYMMAESDYYQGYTISARKFYAEKKFGEIFYAEATYQHPGLEALYFENGKRTWRHGMAPMHYPTHQAAYLIGTTGERLTEVSCQGWGDGDPILKDNVYNNPFWNETALFKTNRGHSFKVNIWWKGAHKETARGELVGTKMSFYGPTANGMGPVIVRSEGNRKEIDDGGYERDLPAFENYNQPNWAESDMLPESMRKIVGGHGGSSTFITHEFIDALVHQRTPDVNIYEAIAYTVPGIIAHESALQGGTLLKIPQFDKVKKA
ncbi:MAG TPA: Gfo/Idh/MocA family oxidoreductase [Sedimentisphaerales bacterium]|nr:Gfo/Idh/MocA family oxidoreductase [Sedimentisphaerales bacterium]